MSKLREAAAITLFSATATVGLLLFDSATEDGNPERSKQDIAMTLVEAIGLVATAASGTILYQELKENSNGDSEY